MNYLFIVTESQSANGICTKTIMHQLAKHHQVYCITNREYGQSKIYEQNSVKYYTVKPRLVYSMSSKMTLGNISDTAKKIERAAMLFINKLKLMLTMPIWPLISPAYANRLYRLIRKVCLEQSIDCIVPIYTQIDTLIAARHAKKKIRNIQYIPYFLDSLSGGYGPRCFSKDQIRKRGLRWEHWLLPDADHIIVMQSSYIHHQKYSSEMPYFAKMHFLDLPLLSTPELVRATAPRLMDADKINLVYVGTLPNGIRSPDPVLRIFSHICDDRWQLYFVGETAHETLNHAAEQDRRIHVIGRVSHETALQYETQATALINIGNKNPNMVPSKIFEYISMGKPIISTASDENEPSIPYLLRYPCSFILTETSPDLDAEANRLASFINASQRVSISHDAIRKEFYSNTPEATATFLQRIVCHDECDRNQFV